jgi:hypothetical protein
MDRYLHKTQTQETNIHALSGIRIRDPAIKRLQTYALDRTVTDIGHLSPTLFPNIQHIV